MEAARKKISILLDSLELKYVNVIIFTILHSEKIVLVSFVPGSVLFDMDILAHSRKLYLLEST